MKKGGIFAARRKSAGGSGPLQILTTKAAGTTTSTTPSVDTTGANLFIVSVGWYVTGTTPVLTDSKGNTWTMLTPRGTNVRNALYYCFPSSVGSGHTFTATGTNSFHSQIVSVFGGMTGTTFDVENGAASGGAWTTLATGSVTPSQANTVVFAGLGFEVNSGGTISINGGMSIVDTYPYAGGQEGSSLYYLVLTSATAQNRTWTTSASSADGGATIALFKY